MPRPKKNKGLPGVDGLLEEMYNIAQKLPLDQRARILKDIAMIKATRLSMLEVEDEVIAKAKETLSKTRQSLIGGSNVGNNKQNPSGS
jgi:uncharacterized tellurite resistance protein B-like protein